MIPYHTISELVLREHELRVARAERGWQSEVAAQAERRAITLAAAERGALRPDPLGVGLVKFFNLVGEAVARITARIAELRFGPLSQEHDPSPNDVVWVRVPVDREPARRIRPDE